MGKECALCGKEMKMFEAKYCVKEGLICEPCFKGLGFSNMAEAMLISKMPLEEIKVLGEQIVNRKEVIENFVPTSISTYGWIKRDDNSQQFLVKEKSTISAKNTKYTCLRYDQLLEYELLEDGDSITRGGLARAVGGAVLLGATGAVVGGITGKRSSRATCSRLEIKLTLRDYPTSAFYLSFYNGSDIPKNGFIYKTCQKEAEDTLSELKVITDIIDKLDKTRIEQPSSTTDVADELRKFKGLLDDGIITQDEFDKKKKDLLNL